jgi:hypothetical protein
LKEKAMRLILKSTQKWILLLFLTELILSPAIWAAPQKVYFAGFAFLSDHVNIEPEYRFSKKIWELKENEQPLIDKVIGKKLEDVSNPNIEIIINDLGDHKSANSLSLALALDWEDVCVDKLTPELYKIVLNLHGQILVFDFNSKKIIATYPFGVRVNDTSKTEPDEAHFYNLFHRLYFENIANINFLDEFIKRLRKINIKESSNHRIKVTEVIIGDKSYSYMPQKVKDNLAAYKTFVAQQFSSFLSANQGIAVLPYTRKNEQGEHIAKGQAFKGKMALRFGNATVLNLTIPEEDIPIKIKVRGFKKVQMDENHTGTSWVYGSFIRFTVLDPLGDPVVNAKFKYAAVKTILASQTEVTIDSDWSAFEESLLSLFNELTQQISERSSSWISKKTKDKNVKKQLKSLEKILKRI